MARVADATVGNAILQRRNDFLQAPIATKIMGCLGPNVFAVREPPSYNNTDWNDVYADCI